MNHADIVWWPDDKKGLIINAVSFRDRASPRFVAMRAAWLIWPMPVMVLASYWILPMLSFPYDAPAWVLTWISWTPTILLVGCSVLTLLISSMLFIEWRRDRREAVALECQAKSLGIDIAKLDSAWVFEKLILPMAWRKRIMFQDRSIARLREE